ncbi:MAG TPA: hypothetical protein VGW34_03280 [Allosphingosinicella sp.]|nr:hypothetical protein [Allosphingosinicella sp.]
MAMMHRAGFELHAHGKPWLREIDVFLLEWRDGTKRFFLQPGEGGGFGFVETREPERPSVSIDWEAARQLMDELWNAGIRPTEAVDNAGQLAATRGHLADMRAIAFAKLELAPPARSP